MKKIMILVLMFFGVPTVFAGCSTNSTTLVPERYSYWKGGIKNHITGEWSYGYGEYLATLTQDIAGFSFMILEFDPETTLPVHVQFGFSSVTVEENCEDTEGICDSISMEESFTEIVFDESLVARFSKLNLVGPIFLFLDADVMSHSELTAGGLEFWVEDPFGTYHFNFTTRLMAGDLTPPADQVLITYSAPSMSLQMSWQFNDTTLD
jgi:hypothetical protein